MDLVVVACLISWPADCEAVSLNVSRTPIPPTLCMSVAIPLLAEWAGSNPDRFVSSWRCSPSREARAR